MDFGSFYKNSNEIKNENPGPITYPSTENSEIGGNDSNSEKLSQSMNEGNKNLFEMNQILLGTFRKDSSDFYDYPEEPVAEQNINQDSDCPVFSASKCCKEEIQLPNQEENVSKLETDQENKNIQSKEFSNFQQPQKYELEFNKNENPNEDNIYNYFSFYDNEFENQTFIHKENNLMDIEADSYNLPSPMNMNSNNADLNSSNINNKAIEKDEKNARSNKSDELRQTTVRKIKFLLNVYIVQPLIIGILEGENEKYDIWEPTISKEIISNQEELEKYCNKRIIEIYYEAKTTHCGQKSFKKNKNKIIDLLKKDNLYCKIFKILKDLRFIDMIKIYYDKAQINNILKRYPKTSELIELKKILASFGDFEKDFGNESNEKINNRKKALKDFIDFSEKIRKQKKIRFITS